MLQVVFKKLTIKNFLSIGEEPLIVEFKSGLNIITGRNFDKVDRRNGVGKSTIADALHYLLFGSPIREITKDTIGNNITDGKCVGVLEFDTIAGKTTTSYKIERSLSPNKCYLYKNGEDITRSGIPQTNELICEIIRSSTELFQNSVIMTLNGTIPFMSQKKVDKRKFIEGVLNLHSFGEMLLLARAEYNETKKSFDIESAKLAEVDRSIKMFQNQRDTFLQEKQKKLDDISKQIQEHNKSIEIQKLKFVVVNKDEETLLTNEISALRKKISAAEEAFETTQKEKISCEYKIEAYKAKIKELDEKKGVCSFCKKDIDELISCETIKQRNNYTTEMVLLEAKIPTYKDVLQSLKNIKEEYQTNITNLNKQITDIKLKTKENDNIQSRIDQITKWIKLLNENYTEIANNKGNYDNDLTQLEGRQKSLQIKVTDLTERLEIIDAAKYVVAEEGVKSILVKKILNILNTKLGYYLKKMEANCVISFNEYFEETIVNEKGKVCMYGNFSGAEKKSIDLACLFTFMDIRRLQGDVAINVSMYDELFDSSLDEKGVDLVLDILKERVDKFQEAIYIISHRRESVKHVTGDIIYLEKRNGITTRIPFDDSIESN